MEDARELLAHLEWRWLERGTSRRGHLFDRRGAATLPLCGKRPRQRTGESGGAWVAHSPQRLTGLSCGSCEREYETLLMRAQS